MYHNWKYSFRIGTSPLSISTVPPECDHCRKLSTVYCSEVRMRSRKAAAPSFRVGSFNFLYRLTLDGKGPAQAVLPIFSEGPTETSAIMPPRCCHWQCRRVHIFSLAVAY